MTRLAVISDLHMRDEHAAAIEQELRRVVRRLDTEFGPDHLFVLGDIIEDGSSTADDRQNVRRARTILEAGSAPVTYLLGNHDVQNLSRETLRELLGQDDFFGVVEVADTPVVCLDTSWERGEGGRGQLGEEQRNWLDETLPQLTAPLVLAHHPLGQFDLADNVWFREYPERAFLGDRLEALESLGGAGTVRGTVTGHIHDTQFSKFHGLPHASVNAFSKELPDRPLTGTYAELTVGPDVQLRVRTRSEQVGAFRFDRPASAR